jgi:hypothetical protein
MVCPQLHYHIISLVEKDINRIVLKLEWYIVILFVSKAEKFILLPNCKKIQFTNTACHQGGQGASSFINAPHNVTLEHKACICINNKVHNKCNNIGFSTLLFMQIHALCSKVTIRILCTLQQS